MVVLKLIGNEWDISEKLVASVHPQKSFLMQATALAQRLGVANLTGLAMYRTEGKPGSYINPTVPVSLSSNPTKEGMKDGTIVWFKQADLATQQRDREMHESLVAFRKAKGIDGLKPDGSDVLAFREDAMKNLNVRAAKDIGEHEEEARGKVAAQESRGWFDVTFQYRQVQRVTDECRKAMDEDFVAVTRLLGDAFRVIHQGLQKAQREEVGNQESAAREALGTEWESALAALHAAHSSAVRDLQQRARDIALEQKLKADEAAMEKKSAEEAAAGAREKQQREEEQRQSALAAQRLCELQQQQALLAAAAAQQPVPPPPGLSLQDQERLVEAMAAAQKAESAAMMEALERRVGALVQKESAAVREMLQQQAIDAVERELLQRRRDVDAAAATAAGLATREGLDGPLAELAWAAAGARPDELPVVVALLQEQNALLQAAADTAREAAARRAVELECEGTTARASLLASLQTINAEVAVAAQRVAFRAAEDVAEARKLRDEALAIAASVVGDGARTNGCNGGTPLLNFHQARQSRYVARFKAPQAAHRPTDESPGCISTCNVGEIHPDVVRTIVAYIDRFVLLPTAAADEDDSNRGAATAAGWAAAGEPSTGAVIFSLTTTSPQKAARSSSSSEEPAGNLRGRLPGAMGATNSDRAHRPKYKASAYDFFWTLVGALRSPYAVADYLCLHTQSPDAIDAAVRRLLMKRCELTHPHFCAVLDLLLHLFAGREAELGAELEGRPAASHSFVAHYDEASGWTYYHHPGLGLTQWLRPRVMG